MKTNWLLFLVFVPPNLASSQIDTDALRMQGQMFASPEASSSSMQNTKVAQMLDSLFRYEYSSLRSKAQIGRIDHDLVVYAVHPLLDLANSTTSTVGLLLLTNRYIGYRICQLQNGIVHKIWEKDVPGYGPFGKVVVEDINLNGKPDIQFHVAGAGNQPQTGLKIYEVSGYDVSLIAPSRTSTNPFAAIGGSTIYVKDIDGDGVSEITTISDDRWTEKPFIQVFKWNGSKYEQLSTPR